MIIELNDNFVYKHGTQVVCNQPDAECVYQVQITIVKQLKSGNAGCSVSFVAKLVKK